MKFYKSIISIVLLAMTTMFVGCSTDGYWDKTPATGEEKYSFDQKEQTLSLGGTETLTEIKIPMTRTTSSGSSTIAVESTFSHDVFSGPTEIKFEDGSNTAFYTVTVNNLKSGIAYTVGVSIAKDKASISGNNTATIKLSKAIVR